MRFLLVLIGSLSLLPTPSHANDERTECDTTATGADYGGYEKTLDACGIQNPNPPKDSARKTPNSGDCAKRLVRTLIRCQRRLVNNQKECPPGSMNCPKLADRVQTLLDYANGNPDIAQRSLQFTGKLDGDEKAALDLLKKNGFSPAEAAGETPQNGAPPPQKKDVTGGVVPDRPEPTTADAARAFGSGDSAGAKKIIAQTLERNPKDAAALALRAQIRQAEGDREGAMADARRAVELNPDDGASRRMISEFENLARAQGKVKAAKLDFGAAPEGGAGPSGGNRNPGRNVRAADVESRRAPSDVPAGAAGPGGASGSGFQGLLQAAEAKIRIGDFTGALLTLQQARDVDAKSPEVWDMIADANERLGDYAGAMQAANEALRLNPDDAKALRLKANAELQTGDYGGALADAERAIRLEPKNGLGYLYRAMAEEKLGRTAEARRDFELAQKLDPTLGGLALAGLRRLGGGSGAPAARPAGRALFRGGAIAAASLLILLGLLGKAAHGLTTKRRLAAIPSSGDEDEAVPPTVSVGALLDGHYRVTRELGRGGMGVVYQAFDETLRRPVAIKQLQRDGRTSREDLDRFLREARLVAQLKHPHVAEIYAVIGGADLLLVFEFIDGRPLSELVGGGKSLPPDAARRIVAEVASALDAAHALKITHRDLKPANVMLAGNGAIKVMDFGIAHQSRSGADATRTAWAAGTPPYMAPEQAMGSVSKASDVYALAVMTYEILTGRRPFDGPDYLEQKLRLEYPAASSLQPALSPEIDAFLASALNPDPTKRPPSAGEFTRGLARALGATPSRT